MLSKRSWTLSRPMAADLVKRLFDLVASIVGLILLFPLFLVVAAWIKLDSSGPVLYRAKRVGLDERPFYQYKFRSMIAHAENHGPAITAAGDGRITRAGHFLRKSKLDELPQLLNVVKGEMSLVGPRPEAPRYVTYYTPEQRQVFQVRPGITSPASLAYRHEEELLSGPDWETVYRQVVLPAKLALDLEYLQRRTLRTDIALILRTILVMFQ